jgi:flagellar basal body-associated protein FliL
MEAKTATTIPQFEESTPETPPNSRKRTVLIILFSVAIVALTGYFVFSGGSDHSKDAATQSETVKKLLIAIGMGPKAGWTRFAAPILGCLVVAVVAIAVLSSGGRDVKTEKERTASKKKPLKPVEPNDVPVAPVEEEECNLSSYKLFKSLNEAAATASDASAAAKT